jgi:hypothetical protein
MTSIYWRHQEFHFGGEGLFYATLRGPGTVYIQSLPFSRLADRISHLHQELGNSRDEGSLLGGLEVYSMETDDFKFNKRF